MSNAFSDFLHGRRLELGLTQREIAEECGITAEAISLIEAGRRQPELERIPRLAEALEVDPAVLSRLALVVRAPQFYASLIGSSAAGAALEHEAPEDRLVAEVPAQDAGWVRLIGLLDGETRPLLRELAEQLVTTSIQKHQQAATNN